MDTAPDSAASPSLRRSLLGILAALVAAGLALGWLQRDASRAETLAGAYVRALGPLSLPFKAQTLVLQRAALRQDGVLPIYGTSELYCCGLPFNAGMFFRTAPTGFSVFNVGYPLTEDLFFAETFGALGHDLAGRRVVVSDSPWFVTPGGIAPTTYAHTYSQEIARVFVFDAPVPLALRRAVGERMLDFPATLRGDPVLLSALRALRRGGWRGDGEYALLDPIGRLFAYTSELRDAFATTAEIEALVHPAPKGRSGPAPAVRTGLWAKLRLGVPSPAAVAATRTPRGLAAAVPVRRQPVPWDAELRQADGLAAGEAPNNPFGITAPDWRKCQDIWPAKLCTQAALMLRAGLSNRGGTVFSAPTAWEAGMESCPCWTDLRLEFGVLRAVGARPLAWLQPLEGAYADRTPYSAPARALVYDRYLSIAAAEGVPATAWVTFDSDPHFENSFGHFTPRGWVLADRLLDVFWHGGLGSLGPGLGSGAAVAALFPHALACPQARDCEGVRVTGPPAGSVLPAAPRPAPPSRVATAATPRQGGSS